MTFKVHTPQVLPLSGGTISGDLNVNSALQVGSVATIKATGENPLDLYNFGSNQPTIMM